MVSGSLQHRSSRSQAERMEARKRLLPILPNVSSQVNNTTKMNKSKGENKIWEFIKKIWKDSVWSKLIATGLIILITSIWSRYSIYSLSDIYTFLIKGLTYKIPIFVFISVIGLYFIVKLVIKLFRKNEDSIWDEQVGNYKFKELYDILLNQNYEVRTIGMKYSGMNPPKEDLLTLFYTYSPFLNKGINLDDNIEDGGYLYGVLAPKLVGYGIVNKIESKNLYIDVIDVKYETSEVGHKFFALLEKTIHLKKEKK